jgi:hypothetical protein
MRTGMVALLGSILVAVACLVGFTGCLAPPGQPGGGGGAGGGGAGGGAGGGGAGGGAGGGGPSAMPNCGQQTFPLSTTALPPNVMLIVDDSGSMKEMLGTQAKWDVLKAAVEALVSRYDGKVNWGLSIFPDPSSNDSCAPGKVEIPVGPGNKQRIIDRLKPIAVNDIGGNTPTETTLQAIERNGGLTDPMRGNYVLLMTDGLPTCNQDGRVTPAVTSLYRKTPSVRTFVVGIGDGTNSDPAELNAWAEAGHTARTGAPTKYYQANDVNQLQSSFDSILAGIASCNYQLTSPPSDPNLLVPYLDAQPVANDPVNGFTYDAASKTITFNGASCDRLKAGAVTKVEFIYGCPGGTIY